MPIPFRTQRMATSVVNRILDVYDGLAPAPGSGTPAAPLPIPEGDALEQQIAAPKPAVDADPQTAEQIALASIIK